MYPTWKRSASHPTCFHFPNPLPSSSHQSPGNMSLDATCILDPPRPRLKEKSRVAPDGSSKVTSRRPAASLEQLTMMYLDTGPRNNTTSLCLPESECVYGYVCTHNDTVCIICVYIYTHTYSVSMCRCMCVHTCKAVKLREGRVCCAMLVARGRRLSRRRTILRC